MLGTGYRDEVEGVCTAHIYYGEGNACKRVELDYYAADDGEGYDVHVTRPQVTGATDLMCDVMEALRADGLYHIKSITWL